MIVTANILTVGALVCFGIAAAGVPVARVNLVALGLFLATLAGALALPVARIVAP